MKVKALMNFNAYGFLKREGEEFEIPEEMKDIRLDLERIGFIEPIESSRPKKVKE
jgi:hypothetical protein